jgi:hypothetical protein
MSKGKRNASLVNECLEHTGCSKQDFINYKCDRSDDDSIKKYSLDHFTEKGYNRQYSDLCSCAYDNSKGYYDTMYNDYYVFICRSYGVDNENLIKCTSALKQDDPRPRLDRNKICTSLISPCNNAVIKNNSLSNQCSKENTSGTYIQICSQRISQYGEGTINANTSIDCNQKITDLNKNTVNGPFLSPDNPDLTPPPKPTNITTTPPTNITTTPPTTKPDTTKPDTTKPDTTKPDTTKPPWYNTTWGIIGIVAMVAMVAVALLAYFNKEKFFTKRESPKGSLYSESLDDKP